MPFGDKGKIAMGKYAFYKSKELIRGKMNRNLKKRIVNCMTWRVLLFGSETRTMRRDDIRRLEACEMRIWLRMERVSWMERRTSEEINYYEWWTKEDL